MEKIGITHFYKVLIEFGSQKRTNNILYVYNAKKMCYTCISLM